MKRTHIAVLVAGAVLLGAPAFGQVDLSGMWAAREHQDWEERLPGPDPVDYVGLPLNDAGREKALLFDYSVMSQPEHQCGYYTPFYNALGPQGLKIWSKNDPVRGNRVVAWKLSGFIDIDVTTIWMDGRPHPSKNSFYPYSGVTTGTWEGDVLTTYTTHIKAGYVRRNGSPSSDQATMIQHIMRHGDLLTIMSRIEDPAFLSEPYVVSRTWVLDPRANIAATSAACEPIAEVPRFDVQGVVPHYLPGKNPFVNEVSQMYHLPLEAVMGGAETMYPEYRKKLKDKYVRPEKCVRYCGQDATLGLITDGSGKPERRESGR
jgi:hypothetical protein